MGGLHRVRLRGEKGWGGAGTTPNWKEEREESHGSYPGPE